MFLRFGCLNYPDVKKKMTVVKLVWFIAVQTVFVKEAFSFNSTVSVPTKQTSNLTNSSTTTIATTIQITTIQTKNATDVPKETISSLSTTTNTTEIEIHEEPNTENYTVSNPIIKNCINSTCSDQTFNETSKTNYSMISESMGPSEEMSGFRLSNSAAIAAGVCLVSGVIGYFSCVGYRRYLQKKYGDSQVLKPEDVYDTTDLKYFEI